MYDPHQLFHQLTPAERAEIARQARQMQSAHNAHKFKLALAICVAIIATLTLSTGEPDAAWEVAAAVALVLLGHFV